MKPQEILVEDYFSRFEPLVEITLSELEEILPEETLTLFEDTQLRAGYCSQCKRKHTALVPIKQLFIDQSGDLHLEGSCKKCHGSAYAWFSLEEQPELAQLALSLARRKIGWNSYGDE
jgi:hypothetical protein